MPSATSEKLNQLRDQLQECTNPAAAKLLRNAIAKLEAQLNSGQVQTRASKIAQRKAALRKSQEEAERAAAQQQRKTLKPPTPKEPEAIPQKELPSVPTQGKPQEQIDLIPKNGRHTPTTQDSLQAPTEATPRSRNAFHHKP